MVVLHSVRLDASALSLVDGKTTSWVQVAKPIKSAKKGMRVFDITDAHIDQMMANAAVTNEIPIDYNHLSLEPVLPDQAIAAGWFKEFKKESGNLFGNAEWTEKAADHIRKGEFRYISPTINFSAANEHGEPVGTRLISAALTIYPFLQGMAPVALTQLYAEGVILADLSIDERRSRLSEAIRNKYQLDYTWLVDVFDEYLVFERAGKKFRMDYKINDNFEVSFPGEPQEVVSQWEVVATAQSSGANMSANNPPNDGDLVTMRQELATLAASVTTLNERTTKAETDAKVQKDRADALQLQLNTNEANAAVDVLVRDRRLKVDDKAAWVEMFLSNREMFNKLSATLQAPPLALNVEHGSNEDDTTLEARTTDPSAVVEMNTAVNKYIIDNGGKDKVRYGDAVRAVTVNNPKLAARYRAAFSEPENVAVQ